MKKIEEYGTPTGRPTAKIIIADCGDLSRERGIRSAAEDAKFVVHE